MAAKSRGTLAHINRDIKYTTVRHSDKFSLSILNLIMQAAQYALFTPAVVVLDEVNVSPYRLVEYVLIPAFKEKASLISKDFWLKNEDIWDRCFENIHASPRCDSMIT